MTGCTGGAVRCGACGVKNEAVCEGGVVQRTDGAPRGYGWLDLARVGSGVSCCVVCGSSVFK